MSRHVNNVRYVRWIETARIRYAESLELPGGQVRGMLVSPYYAPWIDVYESSLELHDLDSRREEGSKRGKRKRGEARTKRVHVEEG
jgi:hypothetical protein